MKVTDYEMTVLRTVAKNPGVPVGGHGRISFIAGCNRLLKKGLLRSHYTTKFYVTDSGKAYLSDIDTDAGVTGGKEQ